MALFLVRYGEIGLKSQAVRKRFERCLINNIEKAFIREKAECKVSSDRGHLYVRTDNEKTAESVLMHTFGVTSFSKVDLVKADMDAISNFVVEWSKPRLSNGQSFAIRARRVGSHGYTSQDVAVKVGDAVRLANKQNGVKVDLEKPDLEIFIEVRDNKAYIYGDRTEGPGGMPLGSQGKVIAVVGDEKDAVACWLIMKRGCHAVVIPSKKKDKVRILNAWVPSGELVEAPEIDGIDEEMLDDVIAFAKKKRASALVLGNMDRPFGKRDFPIFYPLIGMSDKMVQDLVTRARA